MPETRSTITDSAEREGSIHRFNEFQSFGHEQRSEGDALIGLMEVHHPIPVSASQSFKCAQERRVLVMLILISMDLDESRYCTKG
ncbi:hypothetical protein Q3G72_034472 [Acer saccharum]|nr:hypothetical protein Q3G72_034472 [Acer saccharum]